MGQRDRGSALPVRTPDALARRPQRHCQPASPSLWRPCCGGRPGTLLLLGTDGSDPRTLAQLTASDTQPAFLPGGQRIVFTGRRALKSPSELYEANVDGSGLGSSRSVVVRGRRPAPTGRSSFSGAPTCGDPGPKQPLDAVGAWWIAARLRAEQPPGRVRHQWPFAADAHRPKRARREGPAPRSGANEESSAGALSSPAFSPDGRNVAYLRTYDVLQQDGSRNELNVSD